MALMDAVELLISNQVWKEIKEEIREECELTHIAYRTWIEPLLIWKIEGETIIVAAPELCSVEYVKLKYGNILRKKIEMKTGKNFKLDFVAMNDLLEVKVYNNIRNC